MSLFIDIGKESKNSKYRGTRKGIWENIYYRQASILVPAQQGFYGEFSFLRRCPFPMFPD